MRQDRLWMYNRLLPGKIQYNVEFEDGVSEFIAYASSLSESIQEGKIRCPCSVCKNRKFQDNAKVEEHLYRKGFLSNYYTWTAHGETETIEQAASQTDNPEANPYIDMVMDAAGPSFANIDTHAQSEEPPNPDAQKFFDMLNAVNQPAWPRCTKHSQLSAYSRLMTLKSENNMTNRCFDGWCQFLDEILLKGHTMPKDFYATKKLMRGLGLPYEKIDTCINGCMIYWGAEEILKKEFCDFCGHARWKPKKRGSKKNVPYARMWYLPLTPRLQRLYYSPLTAQHMTWHAKHQTENGIMVHPSDGDAWKSFDRTYADFAAESRNVRLGLCTDGFTPFGLSGKQYSCWPVIVTQYNLPPWMCMKNPYMFLTLIIPGPKNPKAMIDVYLQPLIHELKKLWNVGVPTYDTSKKQNFQMRAAVLWTISDFPAYEMLSGWSTAGKLACPYCMENTKTFTLKHGGKTSFFDCYRQFLPEDHPWRRNKSSFRINRVELSRPPKRRMGKSLWFQVKNVPKISALYDKRKHSGYGKTHNWTKRSIFWDLPYWESLTLPHNLDVMHITKNFFDNIINTVLDVKGKSKDDVKARMDIKEYCQRKELEIPDGSTKKPKAQYTLGKDEKKILLDWIKNLKFPDGYVSNLSRCVDYKDLKLSGMKSHDCHVFMTRLLPVAFRRLFDDTVWKAFTEISLFFKDLTSSTLHIERIVEMEANISLILCKLERILPPSFFNSMEHLPVHLPYEARVGGPVQYRWMYPFERFLHHLKKKVKNKARVEGSICNAYIIEEAATFASHYFEPHVVTRSTRPPRHDDGGIDPATNEPNLSVFSHPGRPSGRGIQKFLKDDEKHAASLYILRNCEEVQPYISIFTDEIRLKSPNVSESEIDAIAEKTLVQWMQDYVTNNNVQDQLIKDLALGPKSNVVSYPMMFINGYNFHTLTHGEGKSTMNSGVCIKGSTSEDSSNDFYGLLEEIIQIEYPGLPMKRCFLFKCKWFDPRRPHGTRIHSHYNIVEVNNRKKFNKYEPFALAQQAIQVYFAPSPSKREDNWYTVFPVKPRETIQLSTLSQALQTDKIEENNRVVMDEDEGPLIDPAGAYDDIDPSELVVEDRRIEEDVDFIDTESDDNVEAEEDSEAGTFSTSEEEDDVPSDGES